MGLKGQRGSILKYGEVAHFVHSEGSAVFAVCHYCDWR